MKNLFYLLSAVLILSACSKANEATEEGTYQDYTSFVFRHEAAPVLPNCVAGYFDEEGYCWKIANLGTLSNGDISNEIIVEDENIGQIFFFSDYAGTIRADKAYALMKNKKNAFILSSGITGISVNKTDPKQYPQEKSPE